MRDPQKKGISLEKISSLLYFSAGLSQPGKNSSRFYPSAGARYPLELYVLSMDTGLEKGLYHYYTRMNILESMRREKNIDINNAFGQNWIFQSKLIIFITAVFQRTLEKYGERGYRYIYMEAGHIGQNISLNCVHLNLNGCAIGGFNDDVINKYLDIDGTVESVIYAFSVQ